MSTDQEKLLRLLDGDLPEAETKRLQARLRRDLALQRQLADVRQLRLALKTNKPEAFAPYFSERVLRRLAGDEKLQTAESIYESLRWLFVRTAVVCLLVAGLLGTYNVIDYQGLGVVSTLVEALFGLPSDSLMDALDYTAL